MTRLDGVRVLGGDDDEDTREVLIVALGLQGANVASAATADEAIERIPELRPDVLVSDLGLPDEDGFTTMHKIRALGPERGGRRRR